VSGQRLSVYDHDRAAAGLRYVYPVVSRRAGGISVGVNLNPNNACNWRCIYCQVPGLTRGEGPALDLALLDRELRGLLDDILRGDFMSRRVPEGARVLRDVALSGNGEPTTSPQFAEALSVVRQVLSDQGLLGELDCVLITNGSMLGKASVREALGDFDAMGGRVWFKLDRATRAGMQAVNGAPGDPARHLERLLAVSQLCRTWIQTCLFDVDLAAGQSASQPGSDLDALRDLAEMPSLDAEVDALIAVFRGLAQRRSELSLKLEGVLLYGLARPSQQAEAPLLVPLSEAKLREFAARIEAAGLPVKLSL